jgi:hypothetical protein
MEVNQARDINIMQSVEMRYLRSVKGCTRLSHNMNECFWEDLKIQSIQSKTNIQTKLDGMNYERVRKQIVQHKPKGCKELGNDGMTT